MTNTVNLIQIIETTGTIVRVICKKDMENIILENNFGGFTIIEKYKEEKHYN